MRIMQLPGTGSKVLDIKGPNDGAIFLSTEWQILKSLYNTRNPNQVLVIAIGSKFSGDGLSLLG